MRTFLLIAFVALCLVVTFSEAHRKHSPKPRASKAPHNHKDHSKAPKASKAPHNHKEHSKHPKESKAPKPSKAPKVKCTSDADCNSGECCIQRKNGDTKCYRQKVEKHEGHGCDDYASFYASGNLPSKCPKLCADGMTCTKDNGGKHEFVCVGDPTSSGDTEAL